MSVFSKLKARIKADLDIEISDPHRCYPGYWQRKSGAFVWIAFHVIDGNIQPIDIGSSYPASMLIGHPGKLIITPSGEIIPD